VRIRRPKAASFSSAVRAFANGSRSPWAEVEQVKATNALIENYIKGQEGMKFINVFPRMLGSDGLPRPEIFVADRLHMNAEGYKLWTEIVGQYLP